MNYETMSEAEAIDRLENHDEAEWSQRLWDEVIEPRDVLYYLDAFGDLSLAINCQGLPKDLPDRVIEGINEWDVFNDWQGAIEETSCPICEREFYVFDWKYDYFYIDEYGNNHEFLHYLNDVGGYYWDVNQEHDVMCEHCGSDRKLQHRAEPTSSDVRVFFGESDTFSCFTHQSGVINWIVDYLDNDGATDLYNLRCDDGDLVKGHEIAASFAKGSTERDEMMKKCGYSRLHVRELDIYTPKVMMFWRCAKEVLSGWALIESGFSDTEPTHPDINFTYIIEGQYAAWVPDEYMDEFKNLLIYQTLRKANDYDQAEEYAV
jgi:hypothetical protein